MGKKCSAVPPRPSAGLWKAGSLSGACHSFLCRVEPSPAGPGQRLAGISYRQIFWEVESKC